MSLNIGFKGFVYDQNDNLLDAKFQVHYVTQNKWNDVRETIGGYYSCNAGDSDALTQTGALTAGDKILVTFWAGDGSGGATPDNRDNVFDAFGVIAITYDGVNSNYPINVKLMPKAPPVISWTHATTGTINNAVTAVDNSTDVMQWVYEGLTMHHRETYYGRTVFPRVGNLTTIYNWDEGDANTANNVNTYELIGVYDTTIAVTNAWLQTSNGARQITIKYNAPVLDIVFDPNGYYPKVRTTDDVNITANITDIDNRITSIDHRWVINDRTTDATISDVTIGTNVNKTFTYDRTIAVLQKHYAKQIVTWHDGFVERTSYRTEQLTITNWLPLVDFSISFLSDTSVRFSPNCTDLDGTVDKYIWQLYTKIPFTENDYSLSVTDIKYVDDVLDINFDSPGHYKMKLTAKDDYGDTDDLMIEFDVAIGGDCVGGEMFVDDAFFIIGCKSY